MHFKEIWKVNVDILKTLFSPLLTLFLLFQEFKSGDDTSIGLQGIYIQIE